MAITDEEIAERIAASAAKRQPVEKINNAERLKESGLRIVHLLPETGHPAFEPRRTRGNGMTVAYRPVVRDPAVLEVSTAICRKGDTFSRKMGTKLAIENFQAGRTVFVPTYLSPVNTVVDMFAVVY